MYNTTNQTGQMHIFWGQSEDSYDDAVKSAVEAAATAYPNKTADWFETIEFRGGIKQGNVAQFQVSVRVGFSS